MAFIKSFSIDNSRGRAFPFNIPAVRFADHVGLSESVTVFLGDNGCGKSTLLEAIAYSLDLPLIGGRVGNSAGFEAARILKPVLDIEWRRSTTRGFFFRAEDFSDFLNAVEKENNKIEGHLGELRGQVDESIIAQMAESMNYALRNTRKNYGSDLQAYSHGEAFLKILQVRLDGKGVFLLDEPEAALSPLKQLSLIAMIMEMCKAGGAQFIIATHSPILMGIPGALLYQVTEEGMENVAYKETDHYRITKTFLDNPEYYLRHF